MGILVLLIGQVCFANSEHYFENELEWPTHLSESKYKIGPILHQYQKFPTSSHYFHDGVDFLGSPFQKVFTPITGTIDAGYYSYLDNPDGSAEKTYLSLRDIPKEDKEPKLWGKNYFEISITDEFGNRFEFHHIDRDSLPLNILESVYNNSIVFQDMQIGNIIPWPNKVLGADYSHIHYNIISKHGERLNPFWFSKKIPDTTPPKTSTVYFQLEEPCPETGRVNHYSTSKLFEEDKPTHIVLKTTDLITGNHFPHPPTKIHTTFSNGETHLLDFTYSMLTSGLSHDIRDVYVDMLCIGPKEAPFILKASKSFNFYMKIPLPENFSGSASISVFDYAKNETNILVNVKN
ncbi:MAG: hypothetical protein ACRBBP_00370 [Bdellovibrionales bacterium]